MQANRTWVLIADGAHARFFEHNKQALRELEHLNLEGDRRLTGDIVTDKPGRTFDSFGMGRHAIENKTDPHEANEIRFVQTIADALNSHSNQFDRLIVVAAPAALGELRKCLPMPIRAKVTAELNQDLTGWTLDNITKYLSDKTTLALQSR